MWMDLSLHRYFGNNERDTGGDTSKYLAMNLSMERQIAETVAVCDLVRGHKSSPKKLWLSFDEWNVWYRTTKGDAVDGHKQEAPHLLEEVYNLEDALLVGGLVNSLLRNADRVKLACLAQLINVIAPIMTDANGILGRRSTTRTVGLCNLLREPCWICWLNLPPMKFPALTRCASRCFRIIGSQRWQALTLYSEPRSVEGPRVEVVWEDAAPAHVISASALTGDDLKASNSFCQRRNEWPRQSFAALRQRPGQDQIRRAGALLYRYSVVDVEEIARNVREKGSLPNRRLTTPGATRKDLGGAV